MFAAARVCARTSEGGRPACWSRLLAAENCFGYCSLVAKLDAAASAYRSLWRLFERMLGHLYGRTLAASSMQFFLHVEINIYRFFSSVFVEIIFGSFMVLLVVVTDRVRTTGGSFPILARASYFR